MIMVPYKSVAVALILAILFGPIGVFYSSFLGGIVMCILGLVSIGTMASMSSILPMATIWLFGVIWSMAAVRFYNRKMLKVATQGCLYDSKKSDAKKEAPKTEQTAESSENVVSNSEETTTEWKL